MTEDKKSNRLSATATALEADGDAPFRLVRHFVLTGLGAFLVVAAALVYFENKENEFFSQIQQEQSSFFRQVQDDFAKRQDSSARDDLLRVHEAANVTLTRLFANMLWQRDFAPFMAGTQRIPVHQCRAIAGVKDAGGNTVQPDEKKACYAALGRQIMALPGFRAFDAKVVDAMKKSTVFKIKVYDLRGITVYSSEHGQIGEDKSGNAGWESAAAGKPASELTHRDRFSAFEGVVENRDLISSYLPVLAPGAERIVYVFELYADVTPFLEQINATTTKFAELNTAIQAQVERAATTNQKRMAERKQLQFSVVLGLLGLLYGALYLIVRNGQRIIDRQGLERRRTDERLRLQSTALNAAANGIVITDREGVVRWANPAFAALTGYPLAEAVGRNPRELLRSGKHDRTFYRKMWDTILSGEVWHGDIVNRRKDGTLYTEEMTITPVRAAAGEITVFIAIKQDVTERRHSEQALREAEARFRGLVEQSIAGIYIIQDGVFAYVNPRFAEILGYGGAHELIGRDPLSITADKDRSIVAENMRRSVEGKTESVNYSFCALRKDGSIVDVGAHGAPASYRGRDAVIGLMQDISEKKRADEQIQRYLEQLENVFIHAVNIATKLGEMRDPYTAGHERRVAEIAVAIGAELRFDARRQEGLRVAGYLHDIGKITVPTEILVKPGRLSDLEYQLIKGHAQAGYEVLKDVDFPWPVAEIARQHHERLDGSGYPRGLKGEATLLEARILAVADVIEAMASHRPYRPGLGVGKALAEIERGRGTLYDPEVADACLRLFREKGYVIPA